MTWHAHDGIAIGSATVVDRHGPFGTSMVTSLANALSRAVRLSPLNRPDRILGAGFGVICAWVAMGVAFLLYTYLGPKPIPSVVEGGATFPMIREMAEFIEPHLPPGFRTRLTQKPNFDPGSIQLPTIEVPKPPQ